MTADNDKARTVTHLEGTAFQKSRAFSPAIVTQSGRTVWLAGQTTTVDRDGNSIAHDFEKQARTCLKLIDETLKRVGGSLQDLVSMTVFINDPRYGTPFVDLRKEFPGRQVSLQRAHYRVAVRAPGHPDRDSRGGRAGLSRHRLG